MIVYKWVYKKDNKYYSLMNYGYCRMSNAIKTNEPPYEIGNTYINNDKQSKKLTKYYLKIERRVPFNIKTGFYFWTSNIVIAQNQKKMMMKLGANINAILKCEIKEEDILSFERGNTCVRTKKFKVLEEI